jgi:5-methylcytosine-specific restriction endonuclease McrA
MSERGYGTEHQAERRAALPGARCEACGETRNLERDHILPVSLGGSQAPSNKRWLCRRCHNRIGLKRNSRALIA